MAGQYLAQPDHTASEMVTFCDEEGREPLPASEGDVLAYVGYLSLEGRVGPSSARQYVSAVSRYHVDAGYNSPTHTGMVSRLLKAYENTRNWASGSELCRIGICAADMQRVVALGLDTADAGVFCASAMMTFAFMFQCRSVTVNHVAYVDIMVSEEEVVESALVYRKAKPAPRPLQLKYGLNPAWTCGREPQSLLLRWKQLRPGGVGFFNLHADDSLGTASPARALRLVLRTLQLQPPVECYYGAHSMM